MATCHAMLFPARSPWWEWIYLFDSNVFGKLRIQEDLGQFLTSWISFILLPPKCGVCVCGVVVGYWSPSFMHAMQALNH